MFYKDGINHITGIITYADLKIGKKPKLVTLITNDSDIYMETIVTYTAVSSRLNSFSSR